MLEEVFLIDFYLLLVKESMNEYILLFFFLIAFVLLYRYIIPYCFPTVVQGVLLVKPEGSGEVYAFQGGKVPFVNTKKGSHVKAIRRRQKHIYAEAKV